MREPESSLLFPWEVAEQPPVEQPANSVSPPNTPDPQPEVTPGSTVEDQETSVQVENLPDTERTGG